MIDQDRLIAACDMVGRTGAKSLELGYHPLFDDAGNELDEGTMSASAYSWWAKATYRGAVLAVDDQPGPVEALVALEERVRKDAACAHCRRPIAWGFRRRRHCWWTEREGRWEPGCAGAEA